VRSSSLGLRLSPFGLKALLWACVGTWLIFSYPCCWNWNSRFDFFVRAFHLIKLLTYYKTIFLLDGMPYSITGYDYNKIGHSMHGDFSHVATVPDIVATWRFYCVVAYHVAIIPRS
jgi:hypothetical protein